MSVALLAHGETVQQRLDALVVLGRQRRQRVDEVQILAPNADDIGIDAGKRFEQAGLTEIGQRRSTGEAREVGHGRRGRR
jgi:hypothetical protein